MALMIHFNFKPHELTCISFATYTGLAWQFNYQRADKKIRPNKLLGRQIYLRPICRNMINYKKLSTAFNYFHNNFDPFGRECLLYYKTIFCQELF